MEFTETQRFRQWWIWLIIVLSAFLPLVILSWQLLTNKEVHYEPPADIVGTIAATIPFLLILLFLSIRLETRVSATGVAYRFFPVHLKMRELPWSEIRQAYVREYKPISEYGGWGLRAGFRSGKALNISGNKGLQLLLTDRRKLLLGTRRPDALKKVLQELRLSGIEGPAAEEPRPKA